MNDTLAAPGRRRGMFWAIAIPLAGIAVTGTIASYLQALIVVQATDGRGAVTWFVAALADPTLFAATMNIVDSLRRGQGWPMWSVVSVALALVATGGANIMAGHPHEVPSYLVRVWPPVAFLMALESLMSFVRRERSIAESEQWGEVAAIPGQTPRDWLDMQIRAMAETESERKAAEAFGVSRPRVAAALAALNGSGHG